MKAKKLVLISALLLGFFVSGYAQNYSSAIGLRLGYPVSISYKHFVSDKGAFEVFAGFRSWNTYNWVNVAAAYQHHNPIDGLDGLQWYFGGGASVFFWNYKNSFSDTRSNTSIGILGMLGLDYKFPDVPVNLSVDWVPIVFVNGYGSGFGGGYGAFSARYVLK